jgi:ribulose-phosphate 3-epimerase
MKLAPSILAADLLNLERVVRQCEIGGADAIHVDVMDGHYVPNLTFGLPVVEALSGMTQLPLDVHLMVSNPERLLDGYLRAGAGWVSVHWETARHLDRLLGVIREGGARAGVALNPATSLSAVEDVLPALDFVLIMSVNPGFAGQRFIGYTLDKVRRLREMAQGTDLEIEMDGGIDQANIRDVVDAGVDICVAGSGIFGFEEPVAQMKRLRDEAER